MKLGVSSEAQPGLAARLAWITAARLLFLLLLVGALSFFYLRGGLASSAPRYTRISRAHRRVSAARQRARRRHGRRARRISRRASPHDRRRARGGDAPLHRGRAARPPRAARVVAGARDPQSARLHPRLD